MIKPGGRLSNRKTNQIDHTLRVIFRGRNGHQYIVVPNDHAIGGRELPEHKSTVGVTPQIQTSSGCSSARRIDISPHEIRDLRGGFQFVRVLNQNSFGRSEQLGVETCIPLGDLAKLREMCTSLQPDGEAFLLAS